MKAGIIIEKWKLPIFSRHMAEHMIDFTQTQGVTEDTWLLSVVTTKSGSEMIEILEKAMAECRKSRQH